MLLYLVYNYFDYNLVNSIDGPDNDFSVDHIAAHDYWQGFFFFSNTMAKRGTGAIRVEQSQTVVRQRARLPANYLAERFYLYLILI